MQSCGILGDLKSDPPALKKGEVDRDIDSAVSGTSRRRWFARMLHGGFTESSKRAHAIGRDASQRRERRGWFIWRLYEGCSPTGLGLSTAPFLKLEK
jgi:hypothetical protein